ncbi:LLM class flavin-dependent oxidoreductase, partial [Streptomyces sp. WAC 06725]|uniref:LLM class flavin-dependent oxidoreductase n=1 Tax=Streptomyces sp. WAC 06725 TaxID=2203209 RepID=UPI001C8C64DD
MSGGWEYAFEMSDNPLAPRIARRVVRLVLEEHGEAGLVDGAELLASELIANSYRYAEGPASVRVKRVGARLRVSVWDGNPELPIFGAASVAGLTGRQVDVAVGTSSPLVVESWHGRSRARSATALKESVQALRPLLDGERSDFTGSCVASSGYRLRLPAPGSRLSVAAFGPSAVRT